MSEKCERCEKPSGDERFCVGCEKTLTKHATEWFASEASIMFAIEQRDAAIAVLAKWASLKLEGQKNHIRNAKRGSGVLADWQRRVSAARDAMMNNPLAAAAVKEERHVDPQG